MKVLSASIALVCAVPFSLVQTPTQTSLPGAGQEPLRGEAKMMMGLLDLNDNGRLEKNELEGDARDMLEELDGDEDGTISAEELSRINEDVVDVNSKLAAIDTRIGDRRIVDLPKGIHRGFNRHFVRYTNVLAPNGKPIHVLAMSKWSDDRIVRVRKVLEHFLRDAPGREWGNKTKLANEMANNHATLVLLNNQRDMDRVMPSIEDVNLQLQDLRANESPFEGEDDYMKHETRDAAYEEVFHLIHGSGILHAMRPYDRAIRARARQAAASGLWNFDEPNMPGNHFEYIICVFDNYVDLWKTKPTKMESNRLPRQPRGESFMGEYRADDRSSTHKADPIGFSLVEKFNPDHIGYSAELPAGFDGTFSIAPGSGQRYADKAKHLRNVTLAGSINASLTGNQFDNRLVGNAANNVLQGNGGDDSLFGGEGEDTAVFRGKRADYMIANTASLVQVHDSMVNRDGYDVLSGIEVLKFSDSSVRVGELDSTRSKSAHGIETKKRSP